jgi:hypothetical protein
MVATPGLEETQGVVTEGMPDPMSVVELFTQTLRLPLMLGKALTVKEAVTAQPFEFV